MPNLGSNFSVKKEKKLKHRHSLNSEFFTVQNIFKHVSVISESVSNCLQFTVNSLGTNGENVSLLFW